MKDLKKLSDKEKWQWVIDNKDKVIVILDNDNTFVQFKNGGGEQLVFDFEDHIGWDRGLYALFAVLGVEVTAC